VGISQVAYVIGFEDRSAFNRAFKNKYGISAKDYRTTSEELRKEHLFRFDPGGNAERERLTFEIEYLPNSSFYSWSILVIAKI